MAWVPTEDNETMGVWRQRRRQFSDRAKACKIHERLGAFHGFESPASAGMSDSTEAILRKTPLFASLTEEEMRALAARATRMQFKKDEQLFTVVGARLRRLVGIIEELSFTTVRQRLISTILRLAEASRVRSKEGIHIELAKSHQDLAAELGTVRELVSRNLSRLEAEGFLNVEGRKIVVKDMPGLRREQASSE